MPGTAVMEIATELEARSGKYFNKFNNNKL